MSSFSFDRMTSTLPAVLVRRSRGVFIPVWVLLYPHIISNFVVNLFCTFDLLCIMKFRERVVGLLKKGFQLTPEVK